MHIVSISVSSVTQSAFAVCHY